MRKLRFFVEKACFILFCIFLLSCNSRHNMSKEEYIECAKKYNYPIPGPGLKGKRDFYPAEIKWFESRVGSIFPDILLIDAANGTKTNLFGKKSKKVLVIELNSGCPFFTKVDVPWLRENIGTLKSFEIYLVINRLTPEVGKEVSDKIKVFLADYPLPGWLGPVCTRPNFYVIDGGSQRLLEHCRHFESLSIVKNRHILPKDD